MMLTVLITPLHLKARFVVKIFATFPAASNDCARHNIMSGNLRPGEEARTPFYFGEFLLK